MTGENNGKNKNSTVATILSLLFVSSILFLATVLGRKMSAFVLEGLSFAAVTLVPSLFPFIILTEAGAPYLDLGGLSFLQRLFQRTFHISSAAASSYLIGLMGGYPLGAKCALDLHRGGAITNEECERLMCISNNAGPAFVICGIGAGMLSDVRLGILLYFTQLASSAISGAIIGAKRAFSQTSGIIHRQKYNFVSSVKASATACINLCAFVSIFALPTGFVDLAPLPPVLKALIFSILEVCFATAKIAKSALSLPVKLAFISFAIAFGGLSITAQTAALENAKSVRMLRYTAYKLLEGAIAFVLGVIFYYVSIAFC